jgi:hypothetical protein
VSDVTLNTGGSVTLESGDDSLTLSVGGTVTIETGLTYTIEGTVLTGAGNPNGVVTGTLGQTYYDSTHGLFYKCSVAGTTWVVI